MQCSRCEDVIPEGESYTYNGKLLCEDCYIEFIQPPKTCDVTAVHTAKMHRARAGQTGAEGLTELQRDIYNFVKQQGRATKQELAVKFRLQDWELDKNFAILRHCELLKGQKIDNKIYVVPFEA